MMDDIFHEPKDFVDDNYDDDNGMPDEPADALLEYQEAQEPSQDEVARMDQPDYEILIGMTDDEIYTIMDRWPR